MGDHLLPTNPIGDVDHLRPHPVGVLDAAQMGKLLGEMADALPDRAFLWGDALLCGFLRIVAF